MSNINNFTKIKATFEIITPMFIGDGLQNADSIRPTSVKGALRFWWRALVWPKLIKQHNNEDEALEQLRLQEVELFGAAVKGKFGGQGKVSVRVRDDEAPCKVVGYWPKDANSPSGYITYGLSDRKAIAEGYKFIVELICKNTSEEQNIALENTLLTFGRIGALGARARRANGVVQIVKLNEKNVQLDQNQYQQWLQTLIHQENDFPAFTAFNKHCLMRTFQPNNTVKKAHGALGGTYKDFRSTIKQGEKAKLGLPLKDYDENSRRASPLFLHVYKLSDSTFLPVMIFIPAAHQEKHIGDMNDNFYTKILPLLKNSGANL